VIAIAGYVLAIVGILGGVHLALWKARESGRQECERAHAVAVAAELREHVAAIGEIANEAQRMASRVVANRGAAAVASRGLRDTLAGHGIVYHPAPATSSPAAESTAELSARLLDEADRRLREVAQFADQAHAAGIACERSYDAVAPK
jgi:hypothetical protein